MRKFLWRTVAAIVIPMLSPAAGFGQNEIRPPAGVVLGSVSPETTTKRHRLSLTLDLSEAYDQNATVPYEGGQLPLFQGSGFYTVLSPGLEFASMGDRTQLVVSAGSSARHYANSQKTLLSSYSVGAGLTTRFGSGTTLTLNQGVTYSPALLYGLLAGVTAPTLGDAVPQAGNYALDNEGSYASSSAVMLTQRLTSRAALSFMSNFGTTKFTGVNPQYQDVQVADGGGRFTYSLSRDLSFRLGYTYRESQFKGSPRTTEQNLDIGIDYVRPLSKTRKTTFMFRAGPTQASAPNVSTGSLDLRQQYRLLVDAAVRHQMARTWSLQGSYHRGLGYIEGFPGPIYSGAYTASATGFLNRRTDVSMSAAYSDGDSALNGTPMQFTTYTGNVRARYALGRLWATYAEYLFYYYNFNRNFIVLPGIPPGMTRNGLRVGVTLWVPVRQRQ